MEQIKSKKLETRRDLHLRSGSTPKVTQYKSSSFFGAKSQGGGFYPMTSTSSQSNVQSALLMQMRKQV
jgi:hypothetical protein